MPRSQAHAAVLRDRIAEHLGTYAPGSRGAQAAFIASSLSLSPRLIGGEVGSREITAELEVMERMGRVLRTRGNYSGPQRWQLNRSAE